MRLLFAIALGVLALLLVAFLLLVRPAWAGAVRCLTYEEKSLGRLWPSRPSHFDGRVRLTDLSSPQLAVMMHIRLHC